MAAPKGNNFWLKRSKHGRDRIIKDPVSLWESACEYFEHCDANPWLKTEFKGADVVEVKVPLGQVYQKGGFAIFCGLYRWSTIADLKEVNEDFLAVVCQIEEIIRSQKFAGAASGVFNSNIVARDLGLADKRENEHKGAVEFVIEKSYKSKGDEEKFKGE